MVPEPSGRHGGDQKAAKTIAVPGFKRLGQD
jgi:hypothetical protein